MTEHPIVFSSPMVKAILEGRKTMTRRVLKPQPFLDGKGNWRQIMPIKGNFHRVWDENCKSPGIIPGWLPYAVGDELWVRESFIPDAPADDEAWDDAPLSATEWMGCGRPIADVPPKFRSTAHVIFKADPQWSKHQDWKWRSPIFMPRWASRITLRVTAVKVERLTEIDGMDAKREGVSIPAHLPEDGADLDHARTAFRDLWNSLNAARGFGWDANPWVAAYSFERVKP